MNAKLLITIALLATAAGVAMADTGTAATTTQTHAARFEPRVPQANGDAPQYIPPARSVRSRDEVKAEVRAARADGTLLARGQGVEEYPEALGPVQMSRAKVKAEVLAARANGTLPLGGEQEQFARAAAPATGSNLAKR